MRNISPLFLMLLLVGCGADDAAPGSSPTDASADSWLDGAGGKDSGQPDGAAADGPTVDAPDAGLPDAPPDAPPDALPDALPDAEADAATDGEADAEPDAEPDAQVDAPSDAEPDATADAGSGTVSVRIASGDDALASYLMNASPPAWNIFSGATVPVGRHFDTAHVSYHTAFRFTGVTVPKGATVVSARLRFYPTNEVDSSHSLWLNVYAERSGDSAAFDPGNYVSGRPDQRARTTAFIDHWLVRCNASCTDLTEYDCPQRKLDCWNRDVVYEVPKDLSAMVQEVVDQPGWEPGHAITLLIVNAATDSDGPNYQSSRSITGFDPGRGAEFAPELAISLATP
jgi:hypothetical protein